MGSLGGIIGRVQCELGYQCVWSQSVCVVIVREMQCVEEATVSSDHPEDVLSLSDHPEDSLPSTSLDGDPEDLDETLSSCSEKSAEESDEPQVLVTNLDEDIELPDQELLSCIDRALEQADREHQASCSETSPDITDTLSPDNSDTSDVSDCDEGSGIGVQSADPAGEKGETVTIDSLTDIPHVTEASTRPGGDDYWPSYYPPGDNYGTGKRQSVTLWPLSLDSISLMDRNLTEVLNRR